MKQKKLIALFLTVVMISAAVMGNSYIYAEDAGTQKIHGEETEEIGKETTDTGIRTEQSEAAIVETIGKDSADIRENTDKATEAEAVKTEQQSVEKLVRQSASNDVMPLADRDYFNEWDILFPTPSDMYRKDTEGGVLEINKPGDIMIQGYNKNTADKIVITAQGTVNLTLYRMNITTDIPIRIDSGATVNLYVEQGDSVLTAIGTGGNKEVTGIQVAPGASLIINDSQTAPGYSTLTVSSDGLGAAIGGAGSTTSIGECGSITINSGSITANSTGMGAAIGGGVNDNVSSIIINGGIITATASGYCAAIGTGRKVQISESPVVDNITINGGNVTATVPDNGLSAAIGGGSGSTVKNVTITGGTISANGGKRAFDIGPGLQGTEMQSLFISGGSIYTKNKLLGKAPVKSPSDATAVYCAEITGQTGSKVIKADGADYKINGNHSESSSLYLYLTPENHIISITNAGGTVSHQQAIWLESSKSFGLSTGRIAGDFIVKGGTKDTDWLYDESANYLMIKTNGNYDISSCVEKTNQTIHIGSKLDLTLTINDIYITSGNAPCIALEDNTKLQLTIHGANTLDAINSSSGAAGIHASSSTTLTVAGDGQLSCMAKRGAGIGGSSGSEGGNITINSGTIQATSDSGAGIGGGEGKLGNSLIMDGGTIHAESVSGAGIGGGKNGGCNHIVIMNAVVTAKAKTGAGIGAGENAKAFNIMFVGTSNVVAESIDGAAIGGGKGSYGEAIQFGGGTITAKSQNGDGIGSGVGSTGLGDSSNVDNCSIWAQGKKAFSIPPKSASSAKSVAVYELKNQTPTSSVSVDGTAYTLGGAHPGSSSYYLYLTKEAHTIVSDGKTDNIKWYGSESDGNFYKKPPIPGGFTASSSTNSITATQPVGMDTSTYGAAEYSIDQVNWQAGNVFRNLKADKAYTVYARYSGKGEYGASDPATASVETSPAEYTITIPSTITAGGAAQSIAVNTGANFILGYGGHVDVKVDSGMTSAGVMTLKSFYASITTQFQVNGLNFTDTSKNIASFKTAADKAVPISFTKPTGTNGKIEAGSYSGKVNFRITYAD